MKLVILCPGFAYADHQHLAWSLLKGIVGRDADRPELVAEFEALVLEARLRGEL